MKLTCCPGKHGARVEGALRIGRGGDESHDRWEVETVAKGDVHTTEESLNAWSLDRVLNIEGVCTSIFGYLSPNDGPVIGLIEYGNGIGWRLWQWAGLNRRHAACQAIKGPSVPIAAKGWDGQKFQMTEALK